jgi:hypothetical protein
LRHHLGDKDIEVIAVVLKYNPDVKVILPLDEFWSCPANVLITLYLFVFL